MRLGFGEIVVVLALALLFFGPSKLPQLGNSLGQAIKSFKKGLSSLHDDVESAGTEEGPKSLPAERAEASTSAAAPVSPAARDRKNA